MYFPIKFTYILPVPRLFGSSASVHFTLGQTVSALRTFTTCYTTVVLRRDYRCLFHRILFTPPRTFVPAQILPAAVCWFYHHYYCLYTLRLPVHAHGLHRSVPTYLHRLPATALPRTCYRFHITDCGRDACLDPSATALTAAFFSTCTDIVLLPLRMVPACYYAPHSTAAFVLLSLCLLLLHYYYFAHCFCLPP